MNTWQWFFVNGPYVEKMILLLTIFCSFSIKAKVLFQYVIYLSLKESIFCLFVFSLFFLMSFYRM